MIRIEFNEPTTRTWRRWIDDCRAAAATLANSFAWGSPIEVTDIYRRTSIKKEVFLAKDGPFRGRCAYCEAHIADFQHGDIEHFRPKKAVTDDKNAPVLVACPDGITRPHPGYYWLAYDWRNLLASCIKCNQLGEGGIGKHNRFPVEDGYYALGQAGVLHEKPLLINPVDPNDSDPADHLSIDLDSGDMTYLSDRGKTCIEIFGLNKRDQLPMERRGALEEVKAKYVRIIFGSNADAAGARADLEDMLKGSHNYTLARRVQSQSTRARFPGGV